MPANSIARRLGRPIPDMEDARARKTGYGDVPIDASHPLHEERMVSLDDFGIPNQAYYSRPNGALDTPVPDVRPELYVRLSVAKSLRSINIWLQHALVVDYFGADVELFVEDAWRDPVLQQHLYDEVFPALILERFGERGEAMERRRAQFIAIPSSDPLRPSPHVAGAFDVTLRYKQEGTLRYVAKSRLWLGYDDGEVTERLFPDYYEHLSTLTAAQRTARHNRRGFYWMMKGVTSPQITDLVVNPTEIFHWGRGDQLSARVSGESSAYYSVAPRPY